MRLQPDHREEWRSEAAYNYAFDTSMAVVSGIRPSTKPNTPGHADHSGEAAKRQSIKQVMDWAQQEVEGFAR